MQPRCSICWTTHNLAKCSNENCPNLLCTLHGNRYEGHCLACWETTNILLRPGRSAREKDDARCLEKLAAEIGNGQ